MNNQFLIPANSKKSALILGMFNFADVIILSIGIFVTFIALAIGGGTADLLQLCLIISPAMIAGALVLPFPFYHNLLNFFLSVINYFMNRRKYIWEGWKYNDKFK